ncbi:Alpha/Beta hydrolase protein [Annulohypoxylon moriforme]|nr:Alpha/Beta hydrolase protein [Annulohypoxylon moriforme]
MAPDALSPDDPRVEHHFSDVGGGIKYHYIVANPKEKPTATVLLLHGWPDLGMGWRFQVPYLLSLGLQVIVPDQLGYGQTSAPDSPERYSLKEMSDNMAHIIREVTNEPVILGGHDWGAFLAWRLAMYHQPLIRAIFCFCIPFNPPQLTLTPLEEFVEQNPKFRYQLHNASPEAETAINESPAHLRGFLNSMFGGATPEGLPGFDPWVGIFTDRLPRIQPSPLVTPEIMDYYFREYSRNGLHGPMNWYRTRPIIWKEELPLAQQEASFKFQIPAMLVMGGQDHVLTPDLADGQERYFEAGLKKEIIQDASHWVMIHCPDESNKLIGEFVTSVLSKD